MPEANFIHQPQKESFQFTLIRFEGKLQKLKSIEDSKGHGPVSLERDISCLVFLDNGKWDFQCSKVATSVCSFKKYIYNIGVGRTVIVKLVQINASFDSILLYA